MQHGDVSCAKWTHVLSQNEIREIVMDSDNNEDNYHATQEAENEEEPRPPSQWSSLSQPPSPDYSASSSEDEDDVGNVPGQQRQPSQWTLPPKPRRRLVHNFIGAPNGKSNEAAHITPASTPISVLLLYFIEIITLLVGETNCYYHQFLDSFEDGPSPQCDMTEAEMFSFLALTLQMGHTVQDRLKDYWMKMEQLCIPFYGQTLACARYCHIQCFLHFTDNNRNGVDRADDRCGKYETCLKL